jgi:hypothetical protein
MSAGPSGGNNNALIVPIYEKFPLTLLLEAAVQKTYHELYTMSDVYVFYYQNYLFFFFFYLAYTVNQI